MNQTLLCPIDRLDFAIYNFRGNVDTSDPYIQELSEDIGSHGQLMNAIVIPLWPDQDNSLYDYNLVIGHERWLALKAQQDRDGVPRSLECKLRYPKDDAEVIAWCISENNKRRAFQPSELAAAELRLRDKMIELGAVSTKEIHIPGKPSYAEVRAAEEGVSKRTIEKRVAVAKATTALKDAADNKTLSFNGAASLANFDETTQVSTVSYLQEQGVSMANPQEVAVAIAAVRLEQGLPALKHDEPYEPSEKTKTLGKHLLDLQLSNSCVLDVLKFYAYHPDQYDGGDLAKAMIESIASPKFIPGLLAILEGKGK